MKAYEAFYSTLQITTDMIYVRLDGRTFSTFTQSFEKPNSALFTAVMQNTLHDLLTRTPAYCGYVQSDEISLMFTKKTTENSQNFFDGKLEKLVSVLSGLATASFCNSLVGLDQRSKLYWFPHFDCRAIGFDYDEVEEAINCFVWRYKDGTRNAIQGVAQAHFSQTQLNGKKYQDILNMFQKEKITMDSYPDNFRYGTFMYKTKIDTGYVKNFDQGEHEPIYRTVIEQVTPLSVGKLKEVMRQCSSAAHLLTN